MNEDPTSVAELLQIKVSLLIICREFEGNMYGAVSPMDDNYWQARQQVFSHEGWSKCGYWKQIPHQKGRYDYHYVDEWDQQLEL